jgi:hypothetical protein
MLDVELNFSLFRNKIVFLSYFLRAKFRFEVLFKKFHLRINLTALVSTTSYLLNTILAMETVPCGQKNFFSRDTLRIPNFKSMRCIKLTQKTRGAKVLARQL